MFCTTARWPLAGPAVHADRGGRRLGRGHGLFLRSLGWAGHGRPCQRQPGLDLRPPRVLRCPGRSGGTPATGAAQRVWAGPLCSPVAFGDLAGRGGFRARVPDGLRTHRGCSTLAGARGHGRGGPYTRAGHAGPVERTAGCHAGDHARSAVRRAGQPLAAVPDGVFTPVCQSGLLPGGRCHGLPRPVAGCHGAGLGAAGHLARPDCAVRVAPV